jgi:hypothetical protein
MVVPHRLSSHQYPEVEEHTGNLIYEELPCNRYAPLPQVIDENLIYEELPCNRYAPLPHVIDGNLIYEELPCNRYAPLPL